MGRPALNGRGRSQREIAWRRADVRRGGLGLDGVGAADALADALMDGGVFEDLLHAEALQLALAGIRVTADGGEGRGLTG